MEIFSVMPLNFHTTNDDAFESLARHLAALKRALNSLEEYYGELDCRVAQVKNNAGPFFPHPASFHNLHENRDSSLTCAGKLGDHDFLFEGWIDKEKTPVCIKFVHRYGVDVHRWCAGKGIAPELIGFEKLPGGWYMVVMELLEEPWDVLWNMKRGATFSPSEELVQQLGTIVTEMHQGHMVHGDIRDTNVMINMESNPPFKLLDFDWAGRAGEVKYPKFMNKDPELKRPENVDDGKLILADHDDAMVKNILATFGLDRLSDFKQK
ncbi:hypothetical protein AX17_007263 [Amanita inopinata Kibby_2008]|nr:hypothetical protein AX17_007263 [Amanita inopinata Kibby_2008]